MDDAHGNTLSARDRAYAHVRDQILRGSFRSGEFIEEGPISDEIGVSRTPVREALHRLYADGFVELLPRRGARVRGVTVDELRQFMDARFALESHAVRVICQNRPTLPATLSGHVESLRDNLLTNNTFEAAEQDRLFHRELMKLTGNDLLVELFDRLRFRFILATVSCPVDVSRVDELAEEHRALLEAISRYDAPEAVRLLGAHLTSDRAPRFRRD
ncbi:GntR family transcriptional regulator [Paraburkholderia sacchari]|uniref:GntR family transcriptional regulator n=1 Tax=Paraburkholderia sacchari TaxID=159450 RepID=A0A8T6ZFC4_9BURK|nr:GntR family transcriptional regulator [Paraburkholderia sacchari]NLP63481.1 GntR family transcriptional regulator [Paraburkholderia sacchari]